MMRFAVGYVVVFSAHAAGQFLLYGHAQALPRVMRNEYGVFLVPLVMAIAAYTVVLWRSPLLTAKRQWRLPVFTGIAIVSSLLSLWIGGSGAFTTYGT